jgi:hypothetical protein
VASTSKVRTRAQYVDQESRGRWYAIPRMRQSMAEDFSAASAVSKIEIEKVCVMASPNQSNPQPAPRIPTCPTCGRLMRFVWVEANPNYVNIDMWVLHLRLRRQRQ